MKWYWNDNIQPNPELNKPVDWDAGWAEPKKDPPKVEDCVVAVPKKVFPWPNSEEVAADDGWLLPKTKIV